MTNIIEKITSKNMWIHWAIIVVTIMLFQSYVSNWILKYIQFPDLILNFLSILLILVVVDIISEKILEIQ